MANGKISQMASYWEQQQSPQLDELKQKYAGLQPWQVEARDPEAYKLLFEEEAPGPEQMTQQLAEMGAATAAAEVAENIPEEQNPLLSGAIDLSEQGQPQEEIQVDEQVQQEVVE